MIKDKTKKKKVNAPSEENNTNQKNGNVPQEEDKVKKKNTKRTIRRRNGNERKVHDKKGMYYGDRGTRQS